MFKMCGCNFGYKMIRRIWIYNVLFETVTIFIIIIITQLLHKNKSQVLIIHKWQICKWNKPGAMSLYKGLCQEQGKYIYIIYYVSMSACAACVAVMSNYKHTLK